jgi:hypothetical protein
MIGKVKAVALVDTGSSGTFIDNKFALKAGCKISSARTMNVIVANGAEMKSRAACNDCPYTVQGSKFTNNFRLLQLKGYDVILGTDWMLAHSPVTWDYRTETLKINYYGSREICFLPQENFQECHIVPSDKIDRELAKGVLGAVLYATQLPDSKQTSNSNCSKIVTEVSE